MKLLLLIPLLACGGKKTGVAEEAVADASAVAAQVDAAQDAAAEPADPNAPMGSSEGYAVYRALSVRDPDPVCSEVEALSSTPVEHLVEVVDRSPMPPWVPMRAAACLVQGHGAEIQDTLVAWVTGENTKGLAILVCDQIDALPEDVALAVAEQALAGPYADDARSRLAKSTRPAVAALVQGAQP